jgi:hypothetical protein
LRNRHNKPFGRRAEQSNEISPALLIVKSLEVMCAQPQQWRTVCNDPFEGAVSVVVNPNMESSFAPIGL